MKVKGEVIGTGLVAAIFVCLLLLVPHRAYAHCDTLDGPVVMAAKKALDKDDVTPVLKWVKKDGEAEVKAAFAKTLAVRAKGPEAQIPVGKGQADVLSRRGVCSSSSYQPLPCGAGFNAAKPRPASKRRNYE